MSLVHRIPSMMLECTNVAVGHLTLILQESHLDDAMEGIFHPERQSSIPEHGHGREDKEGQGYFRSASFDMGAYGHPLEDQVAYFFVYMCGQCPSLNMVMFTKILSYIPHVYNNCKLYCGSRDKFLRK